MTPGERYTVHDIARRLKVTIPTAQVLMTECVATRRVSVALVRKRNIYSLATAEELAGRARENLPGWSRAVLQGYDAANRRFQDFAWLAANRRRAMRIAAGTANRMADRTCQSRARASSSRNSIIEMLAGKAAVPESLQSFDGSFKDVERRCLKLPIVPGD